MIGAGATGTAAVRHLSARGAEVTLTDDRSAALETAEVPSGVQKAVAGDIRTDAWDGAVVSPGVPPSHPLVVAMSAAGRLRGDLDLWQAERNICTVAVTGTNGKSTVTRLIAAMLREGGLRTAEGGNLGTPATEFLGGQDERAVLEVSSFQLHYATTFLPEIMVLTNLAPDHLDWHPDHAHYAAAKRGVFERLGPEQTAILPDDPEFADWAVRAARMTFGFTDGADVMVGGDGTITARRRRETLRFTVPGGFPMPHQRLNLAAAIAAALAAGVETPAIQRAADAFAHLPYRLAQVAEIGGVGFWNDSKATNPHAMIAAVRSFPAGSVQLLAGGKRKGLDWASAAADLAPHVAHVWAYGEAGPDIEAAWAEVLPLTRVADLSAAFAGAAAAARPGQAVLLAPGTSSFDAFSSYRERGAAFDALVGAHRKGAA